MSSSLQSFKIVYDWAQVKKILWEATKELAIKPKLPFDQLKFIIDDYEQKVYVCLIINGGEDQIRYPFSFDDIASMIQHRLGLNHKDDYVIYEPRLNLTFTIVEKYDIVNFYDYLQGS